MEENEQLQDKLSHLEVQKIGNGDKLRRKQAERARMEQRLLQMKNVKSPYQDELDCLLQDLQIVNNTYVLKFRSLEYLDEELKRIRKWELAMCIGFGTALWLAMALSVDGPSRRTKSAGMKRHVW